MVDRTAGQLGEPRAGRPDLGVALLVRIADDGIGVGDVEIVADEGHAERRIQMIEEDAADLRLAVAVGVTQQA